MHVEDPDTSGILNQTGGETGIRKAWVPGRVAATAEVGETEESLAQLRKGGTDVRALWQRAWVAAGHSAGQ